MATPRPAVTFCATLTIMTTPRRRPGRPPTGSAPTRSVRIGPVWDEALRVAHERGDSLSQVITHALERYVHDADAES